MEVVLAVITLATAVKDMVELAEKIHSSFEKVSDNLRNAQGLAGDIKQTTNELKEFCEQHAATLENDKELRGALLQLIAKLRLFDSDIVPLIAKPNPSPQLLSRVKGGFKAWRNNDRIDASIRKLQEEVKKCQMNFMIMSVARIQVKLNEMHSSTNEGLQIIQQGVTNILVAHNSASFASHSSSTPNFIEAPDRRIIAFAQTSSSTSTPIWKTLSEQIIWDTYLKGQIDSIAALLGDISTLNTYSFEPLGDYLQPFASTVITTVWPSCSNTESLHREVVMRALTIRKILDNTSMSTSVQEGAWHLVKLALGLYFVRMYEEAEKMGKWAVCLFRMLVNADEAIYSPYLVLGLHNLSCYQGMVGHRDDALDSLKEAIGISKRLQTPTASVEIRILYGRILFIYAEKMSSVEKDRKRAIEFAEKSVKVMEDINRIDLLPPSYEKVDGIVQVSRLFLTRLYQVSPSDMAIAEYARALHVLSNCLMADDQQQEALDAKLRALPIFYDMHSIMAEEMDTELAEILYELISQKCKLLLPVEKGLEYAKDCERIYRRHAKLNTSMYGRSLCNALWEKAGALNTLGRDSDALEAWKEIANIAQQMIHDQEYYADALHQAGWNFRRLKRYGEAVSVRIQSVLTYETINNTTTASQAQAQYDLCIDYQLAGRFLEAVDAAKKAINQYRVLAFAEPDQRTRFVGLALAALANSLFSAGDCEAAVDKGYESMQLFESHIKTDPECVEAYVDSLLVNIELAMTVNNNHRAMEHMDDVLRHLRQLTIDFPEEASLALLEAELAYGNNLDKLGHIQEALKYLEELIGRWEVEERPYVDKEAFTTLRIGALISYTSILDNQGHTELALVPIRKCRDIGKPFSAASPMLARQTVRAMCMYAHLLVELERYDEALVVAEGALKFKRETKMDDPLFLAGALYVVGLAADRIHAYGRVVEVSQEAVDIWKSADFEEYFQTHPQSFCLLSTCLKLLSSGHANNGDLELGLKYGQDAVDNVKALRANSRVAGTDVEHSYMWANGHLGAMYLANDKIDEARRAFEETRVYLMEEVDLERNGQTWNLIAILRRLGIIYCSEGRHDEGRAAAQEAKKYLDRLAEVFPGFYKVVHIDMRHELTTPSLQVLNKMKEELPCNHQASFSF